MIARAAFVSLLVVSQVAAAEPKKPDSPYRFGEAGQYVTSGGLGISGDFSIVPSSTGYSYYNAAFQPSLDYFFIPRLSLGAHVILNASGAAGHGASSSRFAVGLGLQVGYVIPLAERLSLWPRLSASGEWILSRAVDGSAVHDSGALSIPLSLSLPFTYELAPHFIVGLGPYTNGLVVGVSSTIGGWF